MDKGAWQATVHGVTKSQTQLSSYHSLYFSRNPPAHLGIVLVFYCYITNFHGFTGLKYLIFLISVSIGQGSRYSSPGASLRASEGCNQGVCRHAFSSEALLGKDQFSSFLGWLSTANSLLMKNLWSVSSPVPNGEPPSSGRFLVFFF